MRSSAAAILASAPTITRGRRRSTAPTMVSPATAGDSRSLASKPASWRAISGPVGALGGRRALRAMAVFTPPGCTTVTPTELPASS